MSDLEFFSTLAAFASGFILLGLLFVERVRILRAIKRRAIILRSKLRMEKQRNRTVVDPIYDIYGEDISSRRDVR